MSNYKNAFKCHKCPQSNGSDGCPMWWEILEHNVQTGEDRITKDCGFQLMPEFLRQTMATSNRAAQSAQSHRNETVKELHKLVQTTGIVAQRLAHQQDEDQQDTGPKSLNQDPGEQD